MEWASVVAAPLAKQPEANVAAEPSTVLLKQTREPEPVFEPDIEDEADPLSDQNLEIARRAVAADRGDPDVLPEF